MEISKQDFDIIQKYLKENLSHKEKIFFEKRVKDKVFRDELWSQVKILEAVEEIETDNLRHYIKSIESNTHRYKKLNESKRRVLKLPNLFKCAAVIIGLLITAYFINISLAKKIDNKELFAEFYQTYPAKFIERGNSQDVDTLKSFYEALNFYRDEKYNEAIVLLSEFDNPNDEISIYRATCMLELGEYKKAEITLSQLTNSSNSEISQVSEWYLVLINLKQGNSVLMKENLLKILSQPEHLFYEKSKKLNKYFE